MSDAAAQPDLVRVTREWVLPAAGVARSCARWPSLGLHLPAHLRAVAGAPELRALLDLRRGSAQAVGRVRTARAARRARRLDPWQPDSRARPRGTDARAPDRDRRAPRPSRDPPAPGSRGSADPAREVPSVWIKALDAIERGYVAHSTQGWQQALSDNHDLSTESYQRAAGPRRRMLVQRAGERGHARSPGLRGRLRPGRRATSATSSPTPATPLLAAAALDLTYRTALQKAFDSLPRGQQELLGGTRRVWRRAARDAANSATWRWPGSRWRSVPSRDRGRRWRRRSSRRRQPSIAFATDHRRAARRRSSPQRQKDLARAADIIAFTVMPGRLRVNRQLLVATLAADRGPAARAALHAPDRRATGASPRRRSRSRRFLRGRSRS